MGRPIKILHNKKEVNHRAGRARQLKKTNKKIFLRIPINVHFDCDLVLLLTGMTASLESRLEQEARAITALAGSADGREGMAAFIGKRPPRFMGQ